MQKFSRVFGTGGWGEGGLMLIMLKQSCTFVAVNFEY